MNLKSFFGGRFRAISDEPRNHKYSCSFDKKAFPFAVTVMKSVCKEIYITQDFTITHKGATKVFTLLVHMEYPLRATKESVGLRRGVKHQGHRRHWIILDNFG